MSSNSQAANSKSKKLKSRNKEICELCRVQVSEKIRAAHENGKRHKNNEMKKFGRKERKQKSRNSTPSKIFLGHKQQSPDTVQDTSEMPYDGNRNNSQIREYPYGSRGNSNRFPHRRPRDNFRYFENENVGIPPPWPGPQNPPWQDPQNPPWQNPQNPPWRHNRFRHPPPPQNNGYFGSTRRTLLMDSHDANPYFLDTEGSYKSYNSNEKYFPVETEQCPLGSNNGCPDNSLNSTSSKNTEEVETGDSNVNLASTSKETNSQQLKPLKRKNQSVRAIRRASLSTRNSVDSDDAHQDIASDKLTEKRTAQNENNVTGKKIAHWIKPSNSKDEAEVRRLVTEFSKSKKKENLLRLKQQSEGGIERRNSASDEISSTQDNVDSAVESDMCVTSSQDASHNIPTHETGPVSLHSEKSKSRNSESLSESSSKSTSNEQKRKSLYEQSNSKSKKRTSLTNVESVLDSVIRGSCDSSPSVEPHLKSKRNESQLEENQEETNRQMLPDYTLRCRGIRIGSYKISRAICPQLSIILSLDRLSFTVPILAHPSKNKLITLQNNDISKVHVHLGKSLQIMVIRTTSRFGELVRKMLHLNPNEQPLFDPTAEDHKINKLIFLIEGITNPQRYYVKHIFPGVDKVIEIDLKRANEILVMSSPHPQKSVPEMKGPTIETKKETDLIKNSLDQSYTKPFDLNEFLQGQEGNAEISCEAKMTPVESLINYFASGDVHVKKEFDDPAIDAIRGLDPAVLDKVCDGQAATNSNVGKAPIPSPPVERTANSAVENSSGKPNPTVTGSLKAILKELQKISLKERKIKENLQDADQKIQEYQMLLEEWKSKKIKIQSEEDILGHQRNTLVKSMNDLVTEDFTVPNFLENTEDIYSTPSLSPADVMSNDSCLLNSLPSTSNNVPCELFSNNYSPSTHNSNVEPSTVLTTETIVRPPDKNIEDNVEAVEEEIAILPVPRKSVEIPVIDLVDDPVERNVLASNEAFLSRDSLNDKLSEWKEIAAHKLVVNSIQIFEDFLYTCSYDSTAKRFDLKDLTRTVTYHHDRKNVTQLCIEKIDGVTVVFTVCTGRSNTISAFQAEVGTLLNTFTFTSSVASICRGRDKIYAGLRDGSIFTCNCKEQKEIVNIGDTIRSIAFTYQGAISILVTLAVNGSVSIRHAERNGLLIRTLKSNKNVPLCMTVNGDCIYLSGSGILVVFEIGAARCLAQYDLSAPYTSLTVYQDYIFTTSYSGFVRCYSQHGEKAVQVYYGAGNTSLTCINVYNGWVFTGNRFGVVDVFKFDPHSSLPCQIGKCDMIFAREKDLELHILFERDHDLPSAGSKCSWRTCHMKFPRNSNLKAIKCHMREHIKAMHFQDQQTLYNFSL